MKFSTYLKQKTETKETDNPVISVFKVLAYYDEWERQRTEKLREKLKEIKNS